MSDFENTDSLKRTTIGEYKKHARSDLNWGLAIPTAIYLAITLVISTVFSLPSMITSINPIIGSVISLIGSLILLFLSSGLTAGLLTIFLETKRKNGQTGLFGRMDRMLPMTGTNVLLALMIMWPLIIGAILISAAMLLQGPFIIVAVIAFIALMCLAVFFALRYSQANFLCTEGCGPIESLKKSKAMMKGRKWQFLGLSLSFIGWIMLGTLFAVILVAGMGTLPLFFKPEVSTAGIIIANINMMIALFLATLPIQVYMQMSQTEFYEDLAGNGLNPVEKKASKSPMVWVAAGTVILALLAATSFFIPGEKAPSNQAVKQIGNITFQAGPGRLGFNAGPLSDSGMNVMTEYQEEPEDQDVPFDVSFDEEDTTDDIEDMTEDMTDDAGETSDFISNLKIPEGYTPLSITADNASWFNEDNKAFFANHIPGVGTDFYVEQYNAKPNGKGYSYLQYEGEEYQNYNYVITDGEDGIWLLTADDEAVLNSVISSL